MPPKNPRQRKTPHLPVLFPRTRKSSSKFTMPSTYPSYLPFLTTGASTETTGANGAAKRPSERDPRTITHTSKL